jgi:hypothetical protein
MEQIRTRIGKMLAGRSKAVSFCNDAPPGCVRVRTGGVEIDIALRPTGTTEKVCANSTCRKTFWGAGSGASAARFCSARCGSQQKSRDYYARKRGGDAAVQPNAISHLLASAGLQRARGKDGPGFAAKAADGGTAVRGERETLARCAEVLEGLGYGTRMRAGSLLVTERKGAAA